MLKLIKKQSSKTMNEAHIIITPEWSIYNSVFMLMFN